MKHSAIILLFVVLLYKSVVFCAPQISTTSSLVVSSTEPPKESPNGKETSADADKSLPQVYEMNVRTNISNRFATTLVTSKLKNVGQSSREATFSVILPETAYISGFVMEIDGKSYKAYVKEKEEAKKIYDQAVESGIGAAHVASSARDSNRFTVSVNVEPESKVTFKLTYDELLQRQNEQYELVLNIHPGQPVKVLDVEVYINESRPLKFVRTPSLRTGNEISKNEEKLSPSADITIVNQTALIKFSPDEEKQRKFAADLGTKEDNGFAGQFVVQYDVERDASGGEVLLKDGYFVHFFAPSELKPLPKYVVFVLDTSGSMGGIRIQQLKQAMNSILAELKAEDIFSIVEFNSDIKVWNVETTEVEYHERHYFGWRDPESKPENKTTLPRASDAHQDNVHKAKKVVESFGADGGTNIQSALEVALRLIAKTNSERNSTHQPIVLFLTDGEPTVGETYTDNIISKITELNSGVSKSPIFSLSFGDGADRNFLQKISLKNLGFSRHIYEAADASLQLQEFYRQISSPLLSDVSFKYTSEAEKLTKTTFPIFFRGTEIVICGTIPPTLGNGFPTPKIIGRGPTGRVELTPKVEQSGESLEKLWAYLTVKQVLEQRDAADNKTSYTNKALEIALKYSFVTPVSSLVVVKPNSTKPVDTEDASKINRPGYPHGGPFPSQPLYALAGPPGYPMMHRGQQSVAATSLMCSGPGCYRPTGISPNRFAPSFDVDGDLSQPIPRPSFPPHLKNHPISTTEMTTSTVSCVTENSSTTDKYARIEAQLPWLKNILKDDGTLTSPSGNYKLGLNETVADHPKCPKTPGVNGTAGVCKLLSDCPEVFVLLTDVLEFTQHFCPLDKYAGICCPIASP